ncbi:hypothetical protein LOTGIDRAFT_237427 [Lottia gigantea]|uniref:Uncharacterized protein n=1 Tax=Lottia gigantea TaxID=225164 RepID=V4B1K3_LOTGI|nr:hypothetical protein LOTGIDRAFT_237427 [Lottia gigantea]ESP04228.1 hypothetical protein LOTGIDRAFT_237427 [Lottia gigantea]
MERKMSIILFLFGFVPPISGGVPVNAQKYHFTLTTQTNLEKLFFMEEELISIFTTFMRQEYFHHGLHEDESERFLHNEEEPVHVQEIMKNKELLEDAKRVHRMLNSKFKHYIKHPINVYHLMSRMNQWSDAMDVLFKSEPCKKWNMPELTKTLLNLKTSLPSKEHYENVAYDLVILKHVHNIRAEDLFAGKIGNHTSLDPLSPRDIFEIVKIAFHREDFFYAATWAKYLTSMFSTYDIPTETYGFSMKNLFSILASSYNQLGQHRDALFAAHMVLKIEPDSKLAQANVKYFERIPTDNPQPPMKRVLPVDKTRRKYEALCKGDLKKPAHIAKKYYCTYQKMEGKMFIYVKMEILNFKPRILQFYDVFDYDTAEAVRHIGYKLMKNVAYGGNFFSESSYVTLPQDKARKKWLKELKQSLENLPFVSTAPYKKGLLDVRNIGLEGLFYDIHDVTNTAARLTGHTSSMFAFLRNIELGGEIVFPYNRVRATPVRGSVVFFYPSRTYMMICPVAYDTEWIAVTSFFEMKSAYQCRDTDEP